MTAGGCWIPVLGLAVACGVVGCAHEREEVETGSIGNNLGATLPQDRSKISQYEGKAFASKDFATKGYRTGESRVGKPFKSRSKEFNTAAFEIQDYGARVSPMAGKVAPAADDRARTKEFAETGKVARTTAFSGSDKGFATARANAEGRRFRPATDQRNAAATRAQQKSIRAGDITVSNLPFGSAGPGSISTAVDSGRSVVRPLSLSASDPGPGTTLTSDEVRRILNRGQRPD